MKEAIKSRTKKCPVCEKEYPDEDNYCGDDGSLLEHPQGLASQRKLHQLGAAYLARRKAEL
jgi:hypothetical protein